MSNIFLRLADIRFDLLVVTDRYPPNSIGGAEQSLHITLKHTVSKRYKILVITFSDGDKVELLDVDGLMVLSIPREIKSGVYDKRRTAIIFLRLHGFPVPSDYYLSLMPDEELQNKKSDLIASYSGNESKDFYVLPSSFIRFFLQGVISSLSYNVIYADNYRAICYIGMLSLDNSKKLVCLIRDNRFHCANDSQTCAVDSMECKICDYSCKRNDSNLALIIQFFDRSMQYRLRMLHKFDVICVTSHYLYNAVSPFIDEKELRLVPNPSDSFEYVESIIESVAESPGNNVLIVGMLNENKGQAKFVKELIRHKEFLASDIVIHFAGKGDRIKNSIITLLDKHKLSHRFVFHGYLNREQLYMLYKSIQLVAIPTVWPEPFGRVPLEAGLVSKACVSFSIGGLSESILHEETGVLVKPGDYNNFIENIIRLLRNSELLKKMGDAANNHIRRKYSLEVNAQRFCEVIDPLMIRNFSS